MFNSHTFPLFLSVQLPTRQEEEDAANRQVSAIGYLIWNGRQIKGKEVGGSVYNENGTYNEEMIAGLINSLLA